MTILVTGATGSVGRLVVEELVARGTPDVRALTIDAERAGLPDAVEVIQGSVARPDVVRAAMLGVDRLYLAPAPATVERVADAARRAGVSRIVDLSGEPDGWWGSVAAAVEACGVPWTHLWPWDFMENTRLWAAQIRAERTVREPWPDAASAPVAMRDIAAVATTALLSDGHEGRAYTLTGPQTLTRRELTHILGAALGQEVTFAQVERDEAVAVLSTTMGQTAAWYVDTILAGSAAASVEATTVVADLIGRPATTFAQWARQHVEDFR